MSNSKPLVTLVAVLAMVGLEAQALGAPGTVHDRYTDLLSNTPPEQGGCAGLSSEQRNAINRWIDNPATQIGKTVDKATGQSLSPSNHAYQRHNPYQTAKALSGGGEQGKDFLARTNVVRMHKILDVAVNTAPVDGWEITPAMRAEAKQICEQAAATKRLPKELPYWVDYRGIDGVKDATKFAEAQDLNRTIFLRLRPNQLQDFETNGIRALKNLPPKTQAKLIVCRFKKETAHLLGHACAVITVATLVYDGYRVYTEEVSWLDIADENIEGFLASAELVNYPLLQMDKGVSQATGGHVRLSDLAMTTVRTPSPEETQQMIETVRKIKNVIVTDPQVRDVAHKVDEKFRDEVFKHMGTPRNAARTLLESAGRTDAPVGWQMLLDWLFPRDERPKTGDEKKQGEKSEEKPSPGKD